MWVIKVTDWKTIAARISRAKTGDEEATAEERSNASKAYGSVGIDVYNQDGSYRGLNTILDELADKWDTLTDAQKNYIAEQSAGVRNINVFNTMLDTWGEAQTIANEAIEDSGYYLEVQEKHMESMQAKLNQLQAQWQEFWYNLIDTNAVNLVIDILQNLVKVASAVVDGFSAIGSVFGETGGAIGGIAGAIGIVLTAASAWTSFNKGLKDSEGGVFKSTFAGFSGMFEDIKNLGTTAKTTFDIFKSGMSDGVDGTKGLIGGIKAVTNTLTKTELAFLKVGLAIAAIGVAVKVFDVLTISSEEAAENAKKVAEEYQKVQKTLNDNKKVIDSVSDEYQILSEGVDLSNNKNISLTTDEYNRYLEICNQIADIYPSLVQSYDEQGNAILKLKGKVSALNEEYEKERLNAARTNANNLGEYTEDFKNKTGNRSDFTYFADAWSDWGDADVGGRLTEGDAARILEKVNKMSLEEFNSYLEELGSRKKSDSSAGDELSYLLGDDVLNIGFWDRMGGLVQVTEDQFKTMQNKISSLVPGYTSTVNDSAVQVKSAMQSLLLTMQLDKETYGDFIDLDDNVFNQISSMFNNMTSSQIEELFGDSEDMEWAIRTYMYDFVKAINDNSDAQVSLDNLINLDTSDLDEVRKVLEEDIQILADALGVNTVDLKIQLGLDDEQEFINEMDSFVAKVQEDAGLDTKAYDELTSIFTNYQRYTKTDTQSLIGAISNMKTSDDVDLRTYDYEGSSIVVSPVLPDGSVLSDEALTEYIKNYINSGKDEDKLIVAAFDENSVADGKDIAEYAKDFEDTTEKTLKDVHRLKVTEKDIWNYLKKENVTTKEQRDLLRSIYAESNQNWAETMRQFTLANIGLGDVNEIIENLKNNLTVVQGDIENINDAISGSNSAIGLSVEQIENVVSAFEGLDGYDYDKLFESTASGVRLNAYELERLNDEYEKTQKKNYTEILDKLGVEYKDLCLKIAETTDQQEKLNLITKRNTLKDQIEEIQELTSRYNGLTSAYTKWQNAKETTNSYEMYDEIYSGIEEIDELYQRDLTGTDDFKAYMQQFYYGDLDEYLTKAEKSYQQFYEENAAMMQQYFTEDNTGSINFLNKLQEFGYAWQNELGQWEIEGDVEKIAESFGWATSTIDAQFKKLEAHEFKFRFVETEPLDEYKAKAEEVIDLVQGKLSGDLKINLDTDNVNDIDTYIKELQELAKQGDLTADEMKAVGSVIEYLTAKKGNLATVFEVGFSLDATITQLEAAKDKLEEMGKINYEINLNPSSVKEANQDIDKLYGTLQTFQNADGTINLKAEGAQEALMLLANLIRSRQALTDTDAVMKVDTSQLSGDLADVMQDIQAYKQAVYDLEAIKEINAEYGLQLDTSTAEAKVNEAIAALNEDDKDILADLKVNTDPTKIAESIKAITPEMLVTAGVDETAIKEYTPENKTATTTYNVNDEAVQQFMAADHDIDAEVKYSVGSTAVTNYKNQDHDITSTITYKVKTEGNGTSVNGNAHAQGNARPTLLQRGMAFAKGTWGAAKNGASLVGELGTELV